MGDDFNRCVLAAALLAGLVHDIGYALKTIAGMAGDPDLALHHFGVFPEAGFDFLDPPAAPVTRLFRILWEETSPGERYSTMRDYMRAHPDSPHCLAGAMWLSYLPDRLKSEGLFRAPKDGNENKKSWARLEMICQLGSMMALMHDLPLESEKKRGAQAVQRYPIGDLFLKDHLSPQEKASRLYREGLGYVDQEDLSSAEKAFREAADRFERIRLFWESGESVLQLLEVIEHDPKRKREAEEIRKSAIRRGLID